MSVFVAPAAMGLGDLAVALPVVQALIAEGEPTYLVLRMREHLPLAERIPGLGGAVLEWQFDPSRLRTTDSFYDLRDHYLQKRFWWGSREFQQAYPGYRINDILGIICQDLGLNVDLKRIEKLRFERRPELESRIVFIPGSAVSAKCWAAESWVELAVQLAEQELPVCVVGEPDRSSVVLDCLDRGLPYYPTETIADALDVVSNCRGVVSVDTGLMHLAVHQGTDTVGIFRYGPAYIREFSNFRSATAASPCLDACYQTESRSAHHHRLHAGADFQPIDWCCQGGRERHCLGAIEPGLVLERLMSLVRVTV